jgi:hypothetical protein
VGSGGKAAGKNEWVLLFVGIGISQEGGGAAAARGPAGCVAVRLRPLAAARKTTLKLGSSEKYWQAGRHQASHARRQQRACLLHGSKGLLWL